MCGLLCSGAALCVIGCLAVSLWGGQQPPPTNSDKQKCLQTRSNPPLGGKKPHLPPLITTYLRWEIKRKCNVYNSPYAWVEFIILALFQILISLLFPTCMPHDWVCPLPSLYGNLTKGFFTPLWLGSYSGVLAGNPRSHILSKKTSCGKEQSLWKEP